MGTAVELTPAQVVFLEASIDGFDLSGWDVELAGQAASSRRFFRLSGGGAGSYILVEWDSRDEDWPRFLGIEEFVSLSGVDVLPKVFASDPVHGLILEEDLGATTLKQFCIDSYKDGRILLDNSYQTGLLSSDNSHQSGIVSSSNSHQAGMVSSNNSHQGDMISLDNSHSVGMICPVEAVYRRTLDALRGWHRLDVLGCEHISSRSMDVETFLWESGYFTQHCVIGYFGREDILSFEWESERRRMAEYAASLPQVNMHRDFQSENVMIHGGRIRFVDYQGARLGPAHYDAASLLFDPYVELGSGLTGRLADYYFECETRDAECEINDSAFSSRDFYVCAAQRLMQALGAYGNLSRNKGKPQYRHFIPIAVERLTSIFNNHLPDYPAMGEVVKNLR